MQDIIVTPSQDYWMDKIKREYKAKSRFLIKKFIRTSISDELEKSGIACMVFLRDRKLLHVFIDQNGNNVEFESDKYESGN